MVVGSFVVLTGCSINSAPSATSSEGSFSLQGRVMGGQQPVSGASFQLYAVGNTGDGSAAYPLIPTGSMTVGSSNNYYPNGSSGCTFTTGNPNSCSALPQTNSSGVFNITGDWGTCTSNQAPAAGTNPYLYIVATGGNPGGGNNANFSEMAALGLCNTLTSSTFIVIDEVTTVGSIAALYPYMSSYSATGSAIGDAAKLALAFTAATTEYMSTATGASPGSGLPTGYYASSTEINSLADSISSCINSTGGVAGDNSSCGTLFSLATPSGGTAPTETVGAALLIAQNPANNAGPIFGRMPAQSPFAPVLTSAPADWTMSIHYTSVGLNLPKSTTVDANGNVWFANSGNNTVAVLAQTGVPISGSPFSGNGLNAPAAIAMDASGNAWVANMGALSLSAFTSTGGVYGSSPYTPAGLSAPDALAFDASGDLWVANSGNSSVSELSNSGASLQQISSGVSAPGAIAIDPK